MGMDIDELDATCRGSGDHRRGLSRDYDELKAENERLLSLINTPHTGDFIEAIKLEAAHQRLRWGSKHDAGKNASDWFWLLGYLAGKALNHPGQKRLHHIISSAAVMLNWYRQEVGDSSDMRPGIEPPKDS